MKSQTGFNEQLYTHIYYVFIYNTILNEYQSNLLCYLPYYCHNEQGHKKNLQKKSSPRRFPGKNKNLPLKILQTNSYHSIKLQTISNL